MDHVTKFASDCLSNGRQRADLDLPRRVKLTKKRKANPIAAHKKIDAATDSELNAPLQCNGYDRRITPMGSFSRKGHCQPVLKLSLLISEIRKSLALYARGDLSDFINFS